MCENQIFGIAVVGLCGVLFLGAILAAALKAERAKRAEFENRLQKANYRFGLLLGASIPMARVTKHVSELMSADQDQECDFRGMVNANVPCAEIVDIVVKHDLDAILEAMTPELQAELEAFRERVEGGK